jgi:hypothetical protein
MRKVISRYSIVAIVFALCGLSACDSGAKKLEKKPKTHLRKKKHEEKELISVYENPVPSEVFNLLSTNLTRLKKLSLKESDTIAGHAFVLGGLLSELTMSLEIKDGKSVLNSLESIQQSFQKLNMQDASLDKVLTMPEKVVLKRKDLFSVSETLYSKTTDFLKISGRDNDLAAVKMGAFIHQLNVLIVNRSKIPEDKRVQMLQLQRASAQNILVYLVELNQNQRIEGFKNQMERILSCFDRMQPKGQPEVIFKEEDGVYRINGGAEYISDAKFFSDMENILLNFTATIESHEEK